jgi:ABC-type polysaccharide/polyol phosphate transport system ATPase subunit
VGDSEFQQKCFEKMAEVIKSGRTILLVTHSMNLITQLCQNAILLKGGEVQKIGPAIDVVNHYYSIWDAAVAL